ncbi:MAG: hypothetical protein ACI836_000473 [Saprospiraceae bacterium]
MKINTSFLFVLLLSILYISCDVDDEDKSCLAPSSATITELGFTSVRIEVAAENVREYVVRYGEEGVDPLSPGLSIAYFNTLEVIVTNLTSGQSYDFYVSVLCNNGQSSAPVAILNVTTASEIETVCFPPMNVTSTVIDYNETLVAWEASVDNELSYEIEYGFTGFELDTGIQKQAFETTLLLDALLVGTSYDYYIRSYCEVEVSLFDGPFMFTTRACVLPTNFMVSEISSTTALASWEGNGEVSWELEYGAAGFELGDGEVIFLGETEVVLESLTSAIIYDVYLRANCGPNGRSKYIGPVTFTTL